jgi:thiol-disulfide isomerase/thioredoxin
VALGRPKLILSGLVGAVVITGLAIGLTRGSDNVRSPKLVTGGPALSGTTPAPKVAGPSLTGGKPIDLASYAGKTVMINVWASWCGPCRQEAPEILRFTKAHPEVVFLGVNLNDTKGHATEFNAKAGWTHPSIFDPGGKIGFDLLKVTQLPATIYIDGHGVIRGRTQGAVTFDDLVSVQQRLS